MVQATMQEGKMSGGDRPIAWDGQTSSGPGLAHQIRAIADNRVSWPKVKYLLLSLKGKKTNSFIH